MELKWVEGYKNTENIIVENQHSDINVYLTHLDDGMLVLQGFAPYIAVQLGVFSKEEEKHAKIIGEKWFLDHHIFFENESETS